MQLILLADAAQDADRVRDGWLAHEDGLETPGERRVLLDVLAILVERGGADAVQRAAGQLGLDQVRGVHRAVRLAGADEGVHLVDEQDDLALGGLDLLEDGLEPLLELAAILGAGDHGAEVEGEQLLVAQRLRDVAVDDAQGQALHDRGLADAGLADEHGVVLGAPGEDLDRAADLLVAADHRVELAVARLRGDVARILLEGVEAGLGVGAVDRAALAHLGDGALQALGGGAGAGEGTAGRRVARGEGDEQAVLRDVFVPGLLRRLLGGVEHADEVGRDLRLAGAGSLHAGGLGDVGVHGLLGRGRVAAGGAYEAARSALRVVEQGFQQVLGADALVILADGDGLRGLQESLGALGEALDVHMLSSVPL